MNAINRRKFLSQLSLTAAGTAFTSNLFASGFLHRPLIVEEFVTTETSYGKIKGYREQGVNIFKGIPYAGKTSGDRRFRRPAPLEPWTGVRDAIALAAPAIQNPRRNEPAPSEDCLFLNVWTPANDNKKRAVMFYNHGGGFVGGSGGSDVQDGANLARHFDVVVVETNHRLGVMGFLYLDELGGADYEGSGNNGMLDIVEGLKWVNENIAQFGGDPNNVMIWGQIGSSKKVFAGKSLTQKGGFASVDKVLERIDNKYWKFEVSDFQSWMLGFSRFTGEWQTTEIEQNKIIVDYTYTLHSDISILYPLNWIFAKTFWMTYMKRVLENVRQMAYKNEPYKYD